MHQVNWVNHCFTVALKFILSFVRIEPADYTIARLGLSWQLAKVLPLRTKYSTRIAVASLTGV